MDIGTLTGAIEIEDNVVEAINASTASVQQFSDQFDAATSGVDQASLAMTSSIIELNSKLVLTESAAAAAGKAERELADEIVKSGGATDDQMQKLTDLTAVHLATKGAAAELKDEIKKLGEPPPGLEALGAKITNFIKNPIESAKGEVGAFLENLGPTTVGITALAAAGAAAGAGLFELAKSAAAVGGELDDLADKTGMSVPALSRLSYAAQVIGADMGQLTNTVFMLQRGIGQNSDAFQAGLRKMGLSTAELKAAGPDKYLELVVAGLKQIPDASERAAAGQTVLGRQYRQVAAALMDLDAGMAATSDLTVWTAEQAADAEKFEQRIASLTTHVKALTVDIGMGLVHAINTLIDKYTELKSVVPDFGARGVKEFNDAARDAAKIASDLVKKGPAAKPLPTYATGDFNNILDLGAETTKLDKEVDEMRDKRLKAADDLAKRTLAMQVDNIKAQQQQIAATHAWQAAEADRAGLEAMKLAENQYKAEQAALVSNLKIDEEIRAEHRRIVNAASDAAGVAAMEAERQDRILSDVFIGPTQQVDKMKGALEGLADMFVRLGSVSGGTLGEIISGVGQVIVILDAAEKSGKGLLESVFSEKGPKKWSAAASTASVVASGAMELYHSKSVMGAVAAGAKIGSIIPGWGTAIGAAAGAVVGFVKKFSGVSQAVQEAREEMNKFTTEVLEAGATQAQLAEAGGQQWKIQSIVVRDAFAKIGKSAAEAEQATLALWDTDHPDKMKRAIEEVTHALDLQKLMASSMNTLYATEEKYHLSANKAVGELLDDYNILTGAGHDQYEVLYAQAEQWQDIVDNAFKYGTKLPGQSKDIIAKLIETGSILDSNGDKLTDISQLDFTEVGDSGYDAFDEMRRGVEELVAAIKLSLGYELTETEKKLLHIDDQIRNLPDATSHWHFGNNRNPTPSNPATGGTGEGGTGENSITPSYSGSFVPAYLTDSQGNGSAAGNSRPFQLVLREGGRVLADEMTRPLAEEWRRKRLA